MTFSIVARCPRTGMHGMAISSSSPAVAARCAHARAGAGVVATQNITDPSLGALGLDLLARGATAVQARDILVATRPHIEFRQLMLIDGAGRTALFSGAHVLGVHAMADGLDCAAAGNLLANDGVPKAMVTAFAAATGNLPDRLLAAMAAGVEAGGEAGPVHSAGLLVVHDVAWPIVDLRVDWAEAAPITVLHGLWKLYEPQVQAYIDRALDPTKAPRFGVPGDP